MGVTPNTVPTRYLTPGKYNIYRIINQLAFHLTDNGYQLTGKTEPKLTRYAMRTNRSVEIEDLSQLKARNFLSFHQNFLSWADKDVHKHFYVQLDENPFFGGLAVGTRYKDTKNGENPKMVGREVERVFGEKLEAIDLWGSLDIYDPNMSDEETAKMARKLYSMVVEATYEQYQNSAPSTVNAVQTL